MPPSQSDYNITDWYLPSGVTTQIELLSFIPTVTRLQYDMSPGALENYTFESQLKDLILNNKELNMFSESDPMIEILEANALRYMEQSGSHTTHLLPFDDNTWCLVNVDDFKIFETIEGYSRIVCMRPNSIMPFKIGPKVNKFTSLEGLPEWF